MLKKPLKNSKSSNRNLIPFLWNKSKFAWQGIFFFSLILWEATAWSLIWDIPTQGVGEIQVRARAAKLVVKQGTAANTLKVSILGGKEDQWRQEVQNQEMNGTGSTSAGGTSSIPSDVGLKILKITGPEEGITVEDTIVSLELPATALQSKFVFEEVRAELQSVAKMTLSALKGKIVGRNTGDGVKYFMQKGEIQSQKHTGNLEIESFGGKVSVSEGQGPLKVKLFSGDLVLEKNSATLTLESFSSSAKITDQQGNVSLQWGKGSLMISDFAGRFEGTSADGQLKLQVKPESLIDLQATRGTVNVTLPASSGASLNLRSASGDLSLPNSIKPTREGRFRVVRTKLPGSQKGSVSIRSDEANIVIR